MYRGYLLSMRWYTQHNNYNDDIFVQICSHERHPTFRPFGRAMGVSLVSYTKKCRDISRAYCSKDSDYKGTWKLEIWWSWVKICSQYLINDQLNSFKTILIYLLTHLPLVPHICVSELGPSMVLVMACRLFGAKPLPEPMLAYCQLDSCEQISVKLHNFIQENAFENIVCQNGGHFVQGEMI